MTLIRTVARKHVWSLLLLGLGLPLIASAPAVAQTTCQWYTSCQGEWTLVWGIIPVYTETCRETLVCFVRG
jgi:hypothetical protein